MARDQKIKRLRQVQSNKRNLENGWTSGKKAAHSMKFRIWKKNEKKMFAMKNGTEKIGPSDNI